MATRYTTRRTALSLSRRDLLKAGQESLKQSHPQLRYQDMQSNTQTTIWMRTDKAPFTDVRVRRAISHAINRQGLIDAVWMRGQPSPAVAPGLSAVGMQARHVVGNLFNSLVTIDAERNFVPDLAESWEILDNSKVYVFHLRKGVKFHDGTDFDPEVVRWNYQRVVDLEEKTLDAGAPHGVLQLGGSRAMAWRLTRFPAPATIRLFPWRCAAHARRH